MYIELPVIRLAAGSHALSRRWTNVSVRCLSAGTDLWPALHFDRINLVNIRSDGALPLLTSTSEKSASHLAAGARGAPQPTLDSHPMLG